MNKNEWDTERDHLQWIQNGLNCLILRNPLGSLCGYVGVPEDHKYYGCGWDDIDVCVHGGVTFADTMEDQIGNGLWWIGFDCSHCDDLTPALDKLGHRFGGVYKNFDYVIRETESLALQLA
jgi:hypothetical protein